jgi:hypothetical protein
VRRSIQSINQSIDPSDFFARPGEVCLAADDRFRFYRLRKKQVIKFSRKKNIFKNVCYEKKD